MLGKKTGAESKDLKKGNTKLHSKENLPDENDEYSSEANILNEEDNFSKDTFLEGAKKAFRIIVSSYKENKIDTAENLLSPKVLKAFEEQTNLNDKKLKSFHITELKASIVNIEIVKKLAKIKVKFLSTQKNTFEKKSETQKLEDIWIFEKMLGNQNPNWVLAEVSAE